MGLQKPNIYAYLLKPVAFFIQVVSYFKKRFENSNIYKKIKTICVGNFYIGGTGKTSLSIKINDILRQKKSEHVLLKNFTKNKQMNKKF